MPVPPPYPHERRNGTILKEALLGNRAVTMANLSFTLRGTDEFSSSWLTCRSVWINVPANQALEMLPQSVSSSPRQAWAAAAAACRGPPPRASTARPAAGPSPAGLARSANISPKSRIFNFIGTVFDTTSWLHLSKIHQPRSHALIVVHFFFK